MISMIRDKKAEGYVDSGVKILIAIVIGTLLLSGLYVLASENVLPTVKERVESLFDYSGNGISPAQEKVVGDINGDGVLDQSDVNIIMNEILHSSGNYEKSELDVNEDGRVDTADATFLYKLMAKK